MSSAPHQSRTPAILAELANGPATTQDAADATGFDRKLCAALLHRTWKLGWTHRRHVPGGPAGGYYLYWLREPPDAIVNRRV